jgi:hypothetical protein
MPNVDDANEQGWVEYKRLMLSEIARLSEGLAEAHKALAVAEAARAVIEERTKHMDCEAQNTKLDSIQKSIADLWDAIKSLRDGKASWVQVAFVLGLFSVVMGSIIGLVLYTVK